MAVLHKSQRLKKELSLFSVYAIATGTTLSAGFFLLPGLAAAEAGAGVVLSYLVAAGFLVPAMFSIVELATAMPRAGGAYYFLDRSLGSITQPSPAAAPLRLKIAGRQIGVSRSIASAPS